MSKDISLGKKGLSEDDAYVPKCVEEFLAGIENSFLQEIYIISEIDLQFIPSNGE
jgi:hypothetical protein